jgi:hypothetical protein
MKTVLVLALVAGCGGGNDGIDLGGVYMVTSDVSSSPCGADTPVTGAPAYLHFTKQTVLGATVWSYEGCMDAAATMCDGSTGFFGGFTEPIASGWKGIESSDSFSGTDCYLGYAERTAILKTKMLVIESNEYSDMPAFDQAHCTTDEAEKRGATMPCMMHEHIEATEL